MILCSLTLLGTSTCVCYGVRVARFLQPCSFPGTMGFCDAPFLLVWAKFCHLKSQKPAVRRFSGAHIGHGALHHGIADSQCCGPHLSCWPTIAGLQQPWDFFLVEHDVYNQTKTRSSKKNRTGFWCGGKLEANGKDSHYILSFFQLMDVFGHSVW